MTTRAHALPWTALAKSLLPLVAALVALLTIAHPERVWAHVFGNALLFVVCLFVFTVWHEASHALAARALGMGVWRIHVGSGRTILRHTFAGIDWRIGVLPLGGLTLVLPNRTPWLRLRFWLMVAAGPLSNALVVGATLLVAQGLAFETAHPSLEPAPIWLIGASNALLLLAALLPLRASSALGSFRSDVLQLLLLPFLPARHFDELGAVRHVAQMEEAREAGDLERALEICEQGLARHPENPALRNGKAVVLLEAARFEEARALLLDLLADPKLDSGVRLVLENNLAWTNVFLPDDDRLAEADRLSKAVIRRCRRVSWANGTRGAVLTRLGRANAAIGHLEHAWQTAVDDRNRAHNAAWLAMAEAQRNNGSEARIWLETAEAIDPTCYSLPRAREALK